MTPVTHPYLLRLVSGETLTVPVTRRDGYVIARIERVGVANEATAGQPRAAVLRAADAAGLLGEVAAVEKAPAV